jgi:hypothetical protein
VDRREHLPRTALDVLLVHGLPHVHFLLVIHGGKFAAGCGAVLAVVDAVIGKMGWAAPWGTETSPPPLVFKVTSQ